MRKLIAALFMLAAATLPAGAVSTTTVTLTTAWTDLGAGPLQIQTNNQSQTLYQIGDAAPAIGARGFYLQGVGVPLTVATGSHVYVRAQSTTARGGAPAVTYAPVVLATSTGSSTFTQTVPPASGTGGYAALTLSTTPTTSAIPAGTRKSLFVYNQSASATVTICAASTGITPAANAAGCITLLPNGGNISYPASGYVPQDAFNAVASAANTPVTVEMH